MSDPAGTFNPSLDLSPVVACWYARAVRLLEDEARRDGRILPPEVVAANAFVRRARDFAGGVPVSGSASVPALVPPPGTGAMVRGMSTSEVAEFLGCTARNVRKRAGSSLPGRLVDGAWLFDRAAIEAMKGRSA